MSSNSMAYQLDDRRKMVTRDGRAWRIRPREYQLLAFLHAHKGEIISVGRLIALFFGEGNFPEPANVRVQVYNLRKAIANDVVDTFPGYGYGVGVND